jgi:hypothetical protein
MTMIISFYFLKKTTKMTGYPIAIKVRHEIKKTMEFKMNFIINSVAAKQIIDRIINKFYNFSPK